MRHVAGMRERERVKIRAQDVGPETLREETGY
jgi:hypothetical protein